MNDTSEMLKPCPLCGSKAEIERRGDRRQSTIYQCTSCNCRLETGEEWGYGRAWNTRAAASAEPVAWQWQSPGGTEWHTMTSHDDRSVREALEAQGYKYRPLYTHPAPDAEIVAALEEINTIALGGWSNRYDQDFGTKADEYKFDCIREQVRNIRAALAKAKGGSRT